MDDAATSPPRKRATRRRARRAPSPILDAQRARPGRAGGPASTARSAARRRHAAVGVWTRRDRPRARGACTPGRAQFGETALVLLVASPLADLLREQHEVQEAMLVGIPIALLLAGAGGLWLASVGLRPITEMARRAARIPLTGLEDLGDPDRTDELGQLARGVQRPGRAAARGAADAAAVHGRRVARAAHARLGRSARPPTSRSAASIATSREYREALAIVGDQARRAGPARRRHARARARRCRRLSAPAGGPVSRRSRRRLPPRRRRARSRARRHRFASAASAGDSVSRRRGAAAAAGAERRCRTRFSTRRPAERSRWTSLRERPEP